MFRREFAGYHLTGISCFSLILMYFKGCGTSIGSYAPYREGEECSILLPLQSLYPVNKLQVKCQALTKFCLVVLCSLVSLIYCLVGRINFLPSKALLEQFILFEGMKGLTQSKSCMKRLYNSLFCSVRNLTTQPRYANTPSGKESAGMEMWLIFSKCNCDQVFYMELRPGQTHLTALHFFLGVAFKQTCHATHAGNFFVSVNKKG